METKKYSFARETWQRLIRNRLAAAGLFVLCLLAMAGGGFRPFIYFQF